MSSRLRLFTLSLALLIAVGTFAPPTVRAETDEEAKVRKAVEFARDRVYPALVNIAVIARQFVQGREMRAPGAGSGVVVSPGGYVVTNYHVAGDATRVTCKLTTGEVVDADIICGDPFTDLCILKMRLDQRKDTTKPVAFAAVGDSSKLRVGDQVLAMGNPHAMSSSVTLGIVSNTARVFTSFTGDRIESMQLGGNATGIFNQWIQHDALILPGNSGGPLINLQGEIVGINTRGGGGVGFAIPSNMVTKVLNQALTYGEVRRGFVGLSVDPVNHLEREDGALVSAVMPGGPADKAGIQPGDVIVSIAGERVSVQGFEDVPTLLSRIADLPQNKPAKVVYERGGEIHSIDVMVAPMEKHAGEEQAYSIWGVSAMDITTMMAFSRNYPNTDGVLLRTLRPGGPPDAAKPALRSGDVILEIAGKPVKNSEDFARLMRKHKRSKALSVKFRRGKRDMITVLDMSKKPSRRGSGELAKAWLGVQTQVLTPKVATALNLEGKKGFRVTRVLPWTEAEKAGLKAGDIITAVDGDELNATSLQDAQILRHKIEDMDIGVDAKLAVIRGLKEIEVSVTLEETPETAADARSAEDELLEYKVRELTYMDRVDLELTKEYEGLMVADVTLGSWANVAGLRSGDMILRIQGEEIRTIKAFKEFVKRLADERPKRIRFFVRRGRSTAFVFVQPDWPRDN